MEKLRLYLAVILILHSYVLIEGQNSVNVNVYPEKTITLEYEYFDINTIRSKFARSGSLDYSYTLKDGTQIRATCQRKGQPIEVYETPPPPAVYRIFKEFYPNGKLKQKGLYLPQQFPIGKWLKYDEKGNCSIIDMEVNRQEINYNEMLKILDKNGFLSGAGNWGIFVVWYNEYLHQWGAKLRKGAEYRTITIDAKSGKILDEFEFYAKQDLHKSPE